MKCIRALVVLMMLGLILPTLAEDLPQIEWSWTSDGLEGAMEETCFDNVIVHSGCYGWEGYDMGENENGEPVWFTIDLDFPDCEEDPLFISASWADVVEETSDYDTEISLSSWEGAKAGRTYQCVSVWQDSGNTQVYHTLKIYLPDDPTIAGQQTILIKCENKQAEIKLNLTYLGDYKTGAGWDVTLLDIAAR